MTGESYSVEDILMALAGGSVCNAVGLFVDLWSPL